MFKQLQEVVKNVEVVFHEEKSFNGKQRVPFSVKAMNEGFTKGWVLNYTSNKGYDGLFNSTGVESLVIPNFSALSRYIVASYVRFTEGANREKMSNNLSRSIFEVKELNVRFTVTSRKNSAYVALTILDESSPFYMLTVPFVVGPDQNNPNSFYIIGTSKFYNVEEDTFTSLSAYLSPKIQRVVAVNYDKADKKNYARLNVELGGNGIVAGRKGTSISQADYDYMQKINSKYKAMAMLVEFELLEEAHSRYSAVEQVPVLSPPTETEYHSLV